MTYDELEAAYYIQQQEMQNLKEDLLFSKEENNILELEITDLEITLKSQTEKEIKSSSLADNIIKNLKNEISFLDDMNKHLQSNPNRTKREDLHHNSIHNPMRPPAYTGDITESTRIAVPVTHPMTQYERDMAHHNNSNYGMSSQYEREILHVTEQLAFHQNLRQSHNGLSNELHVMADVDNKVFRLSTSALGDICDTYPEDVINIIEELTRNLKNIMLEHFKLDIYRRTTQTPYNSPYSPSVPPIVTDKCKTYW